MDIILEQQEIKIVWFNDRVFTIVMGLNYRYHTTNIFGRGKLLNVLFKNYYEVYVSLKQNKIW